MTDKLTDSEILKALECCNIFMVKHCVDCPLFERNAISCEKRLGKLTLDLINRLQEEIERLKSMNQAKLDMIHDLRADLETAKAEAYKEFAKKLKHKAINIGVNDSIVSTFAIDETLKELVGDNNA